MFYTVTAFALLRMVPSLAAALCICSTDHAMYRLR